MKTFRIRYDDQPVTIRLYSLDEYESDGGIYSDAGNGGEKLTPEERTSFIAAASVASNYTGLPDNDLLEEAGCTDYWYDSATGYYLLREWPSEASLEARMLEG